jgi:large subunit ribosomal protein L25
MKTIDLSVQPRTTTGKGFNRRSRVLGIIPGVVYGQGLTAKSVSIAPIEIKKLEKAIGHNVFITMKTEDKDLNGKTVLVRDYQTHPLKHNLIHADFITVDLEKPIVVEVEVELVGKPIGLAKQGVLTSGRREISIRCLPKDIPEKITVDVSGLDLLESLHIADVKMPAGLKAVYTTNFTIASVTATREEAVKVAEVVAVEGAEGAAAAAPGAAGAPAAGAAGAPAAGAAGAKPGAAAPAAGAKAPAGGDKKK